MKSCPDCAQPVVLRQRLAAGIAEWWCEACGIVFLRSCGAGPYGGAGATQAARERPAAMSRTSGRVNVSHGRSGAQG